MEASDMVQERAKAHLQELSKLAGQLNEATDLYTQELKAIEEALNATRIGIEYFQSEPFFKTEPAFSPTPPAAVDWQEYFLGYGKENQAWGFLVREVRFSSFFEEIDPGKEVTFFPEEEEPKGAVWWQKPLLNCSRNLRIAAADVLVDFLEELKKEVQRKIDSLNKISDHSTHSDSSKVMDSNESSAARAPVTVNVVDFSAIPPGSPAPK